MVDNHYDDPRLAELYDFDSPWAVDREFYLSLAGSAPKNILDLGCGTGLLCNAYAAKGHHVTGVDPSPAMLAVARRKPHGGKIEWVQAPAQCYTSDKRFDLIIMTGHAFQVLLNDDDIARTFSTMRTHLAADGVIVFESRNPAIDWRSQWNYEIELHLGKWTVRESRRFLKMNGDRMMFELRYNFPDNVVVSSSELRFSSRAEIEEHLAASGLRVSVLMGDWDCTPFDERLSLEMIFKVRAN